MVGSRSVAALGLAGALLLNGCTGANYGNQNTSPVNFRIVTVSPQPLFSDVDIGGAVVSDVVTATVAARPKNPLNTNVPQIAEAVFMERYTVRYFRSDGRNVEGVDVPYNISGELATVVDIDLTDKNTDVAIELVRGQAKAEPPLRNLRGPVVDTINGGALIITCFAELTIYGRTVAGEAVQSTVRTQIDFANFPDQ
jgi:hypothetical protein